METICKNKVQVRILPPLCVLRRQSQQKYNCTYRKATNLSLVHFVLWSIAGGWTTTFHPTKWKKILGDHIFLYDTQTLEDSIGYTRYVETGYCRFIKKRSMLLLFCGQSDNASALQVLRTILLRVPYQSVLDRRPKFYGHSRRFKFEAIPTAEGFICSFLSFSSKMKCVFHYTGAKLD